MKAIVAATALAVLPSYALAQDVVHDTIGNICLTSGECVEMVHPMPSPSLEACEASLANRHMLLMLYLQQRGIAPQVALIEVDCQPAGEGA